jgi:hypothetical protein
MAVLAVAAKEPAPHFLQHLVDSNATFAALAELITAPEVVEEELEPGEFRRRGDGKSLAKSPAPGESCSPWH